MVFGGMAAQVIAVATRLKVPDVIGDGGCTADQAAAECGIPAPNMRRLLRALAALELLTETAPDRFALAPAGELLRSDGEGSLFAFARMFTDPVMLQAWQGLESSLRTGETAFDKEFGTDFFDHLKTDPELSAFFNASMAQGTGAVAAALPGSYDFGPFRTLVDVGGGDGTLISPVLAAYPHLRGIVYDSPEGAAQAPEKLRAAGVADRCEVESGDFFTAVPEGGDAYLLKSIVHDWDDDRAATILGHCRRALPAHGRLLLVEPVLPETVDGSLRPTVYLTDLNMLVNIGGRERTRGEFERLCARAGFTLTDVRPLEYGFCLIEATPA